ncbi:MAG: LPXTG cell wall anchor domain-containing protein, partial [Oscillospiraceae bacterium]|nr:LPXTG cell wall anchor domain-containing protein [Oscillospiraceae bacterium]
MANEKGTEITYTFKNTVIPEEPEIPDEPTPDEPAPDVPAPAEPAPAEPAPGEATTVTEHHRKNSGTAKTGDDSNLMLWTVLGLTSLAACGGALVLTRKKAKTQTGKRQR